MKKITSLLTLFVCSLAFFPAMNAMTQEKAAKGQADLSTELHESEEAQVALVMKQLEAMFAQQEAEQKVAKAKKEAQEAVDANKAATEAVEQAQELKQEVAKAKKEAQDEQEDVLEALSNE